MKGKTRAVQKMRMGGKAIAGTLSPLYGAATGEGAFGEIGQMGLAGQLGKAYRKSKKKEEEVTQNPRNVPVDESGMAKAPRAMKKGGKVEKKAVGGELNVGRTLAQNARDISQGGLDVGSGFGGGGKAFAGMMQNAMKKTARQLSGVEANPRNVPVDSGGMAPAARAMKKGGVVTKGIDGCAMKGKTRAKRSK